jgi:hypothetical protein
MTSRLTVVLPLLLLAVPMVIYWLWLLNQPIREKIQCPEKCRCGEVGLNVNCSNSGLNRIPSILATQVRILLLSGNNITVFESDSFVSKGLIELEMLKADFCKIRKIELGAFNGLTKLTKLSMKGNEIIEILPSTFKNISRLEYLDFEYNKIEHLEVDVFSGLFNLKYIYLKGNKLRKLHPDTFFGLRNLQRLYLSNNSDLQLQTYRHFINSHSLKHLGISHCNISSVSVETFANITALESLDFNGNNLRSLDISILKSLPRLSTIYLNDNPLQCDCQLKEVWRWCQDHNIKTAYKETVPICDTPSDVKGMWWGVLEEGQCLQHNIHYNGDYKNKRYNYTHLEDMDMDMDTKTDTVTLNKQRRNDSRFVKQCKFPVSAVLFIFGTTGNVIIIIIIICNKDMRNVPNMYILNLAISDMIYLAELFLDTLRERISITWERGEIGCGVFAFWLRMSLGLTAYSVAVLSIQRYRVIVNPLHVHVSSQPTWRGTGAVICGVWIVAALFALPTTRAKYLCVESILLWRTSYYQHVTIFHLLVSCVLPMCVIAFSYTMSARHLVESSCSFSEGTQNHQLNARKTTAKVVLGLTVVFLISYVPYHICKAYFFYSINFGNTLAKLVDESESFDNFIDIMMMLKHLVSINSCLNPVALCCTSIAFRKHFKRYLTCCCKAKSPPTDFELSRRN